MAKPLSPNAWTNVLPKIEFYDGSQTWALPDPITKFATNDAGASPDQTFIVGQLETLYNTSTEARSAIDGAITSGNLRIAQAASGSLAWSSVSENVVGYNLTDIDHFYYINTQGTLVKEIPALTLIHEIIHVGLKLHDLAADTEDYLNSATADHAGDTLRAQNIVASQMGWTSNVQASYLAGSLDSDARFAELTPGKNYTDNQTIDIARYGSTNDDNLDHTARTTLLRDLMFGFQGNDTIKSGAGDDYLYGGSGTDTLDGGAGVDHLFGEGDADTLMGGIGDDYLNGGAGVDAIDAGDGNDTIILLAGDTDRIAGGIGKDTVHVDGSANTFMFLSGNSAAVAGAAELSSVETVIGGSGDDTLYASPTDVISFDGGAGRDTLSFEDLSSPITLTVTHNGTLRGVNVDLTNVEVVRGTNYADTIYLDGDTQSFDGGGGRDVFYVSNNRRDIDIGAGDDKIVNSGSRNTLHGGAGNDAIISSGDAEIVYGGAGDDYIDVRAGWTPTTRETLATVHFGAGDGHDYLASDQYQTDNGYYLYNGVGSIVFDGLSRSDVEFVWDWTNAPQNSINYYSGDFAIRIIATGDTIYLGEHEAMGTWDFSPPEDQWSQMVDGMSLVFTDQTVTSFNMAEVVHESVSQYADAGYFV